MEIGGPSMKEIGGHERGERGEKKFISNLDFVTIQQRNDRILATSFTLFAPLQLVSKSHSYFV